MSPATESDHGAVAFDPAWNRRWVLRVGAIAVLYNAAVTVGAWQTHDWPFRSGPVQVVTALLAVSALVLVVSAVVRPDSLIAGQLFIGGVVLANAVVLGWAQPGHDNMGAPPVSPMTSVAAALAAALIDSRLVAGIVIALLGVVTAGIRWLQDGPLLAILGAAGMVSGALIAGVFLRLLVGAYADAERLESQGRRAELQVLASQRVQGVREEWDRLLHDKVLGALVLVSRAGTFEVAAAARALAGDALRALRGVGDTATAMNWASMAARRGLRLVGDTEPPAGLPLQVRADIDAAVAEVFANVQRHSGVDVVECRVVGDSTNFTVVLSDAGRGFAEESATGFGLGHSIPGHMSAAGGLARVTSQPGQGTTVTLTRQEGPRVADRPLPRPRLEVWGIPLTRLVPPAWAVLHLPLAWTATHGQWPSGRWPLAVWLSALSIVGAGALAGSKRAPVTVATVLVWAGAVAVVAGATPSPWADWGVWYIGALLPGPAAMLIAGRPKLAWAATILVPASAWLAISASHAHFGPPTRALTSFSALAAVLLMVQVAQIAVRRADNRARRAGDSVLRAARSEARLEQGRAEATRLREELSSDTLRILQRLVDEEVFTEEDRAAAVIAEAMVRDRLFAGPLLDPEITSALRLARRSGAVVRLRVSGDEVPPQTFREALLRVLQTAPPDSKIAAQWNGSDGGTILIEDAVGASRVRIAEAVGGLGPVETYGTEVLISISSAQR